MAKLPPQEAKKTAMWAPKSHSRTHFPTNILLENGKVATKWMPEKVKVGDYSKPQNSTDARIFHLQLVEKGQVALKIGHVNDFS